MRILAITIPALVLSACGHAESTASESGAARSKQFALSGFDQVALRGSDNVDVVVGKDFSISATGPQSVLDELELTVDGGVLKVGRKSGSWSMGWSEKGHARIVVTMPSIRGAKLAGSGDLTVDHAKADDFNASVAGSGDLKVGQVEAKSVNLNIAGSGNIGIAGQTQKLKLAGAGSGSISAKDLKSDTAEISIAGSGNASAQATGSASVSIMGSSNVQISGTDNCKVSKVGSGNVSCKA